MANFRPVTDDEWNYLIRRFAGLRLPGMRALFDRSLPGSEYTAAERRRYRAEIFAAMERIMASTEAYPNPYFELTWMRAVKSTPSLMDDMSANRKTLWDAYFRPEEAPFDREAAQDRWAQLNKARRKPSDDLVVVTDGEELEHAE